MLGLEKLLKVMDPEPVLIDQRACLRARHRRSPCRGCSDVCPAGAVGFAEGRLAVDPVACTRCGLCAGACPTAALLVRGIDEGALAGAVRVRCARAAGAGVELPCLGWLTPDHLVDLGSRHPGVELAAGDCGTCPLKRGGEQAQAALAAAVATLAALGVTAAPRWVTGAPAPAAGERPVSRRQLFTMWRRDAVQTGRGLMPEREVNPVQLPAQVPARRLRWLRRFTAPAGLHTLDWPARGVRAGCNGCNICVSFCPTGALAAREEAGVWKLSFQAAACVDCRTCIHLCPRRVLAAAEAPTVREVLEGGRRELAAVAPADRPQAVGFRPVR